MEKKQIIRSVFKDTHLEGKNIVNLTPHTINLVVGKEETITIEPEGDMVARAREEVIAASRHLKKMRITEVIDLPEPQEDTVFIVSKLVAIISNRTDLLVPCDFVRDEDNRIIGCRNLSMLEG